MSAHTLEVRHGRVVFDVERNGHDSDMGINEIQVDEERVLVVCAMAGATPACIPPVTTSWRSERSRLFDDEPDEPGIEHEFFSRGWQGVATLGEDGVLEVTGPADPPTPGLVGRHTLDFSGT